MGWSWRLIRHTGEAKTMTSDEGWEHTYVTGH